MTFTNGIKIPSWALAAIVAAFAVLGFGFKIGAQVSNNAARMDRIEDRTTVRLERIEDRAGGLDFRLCRIEKALQIAPYQTCK